MRGKYGVGALKEQICDVFLTAADVTSTTDAMLHEHP